MKVSISEENGNIVVKSPYCRRFVERAKDLGGKFSDGKAWVFPGDIAEPVRDAVRQFYGGDGSEPACTVRITLDGMSWWHGLDCEFMGRPLARGYGRDAGAKIAEGVSVLSGGFSSGGSMKNWVICCEDGTVVQLRDMPLPAMREMVESGEFPDGVSAVEIVGPSLDHDVGGADEISALLDRIKETNVCSSDLGGLVQDVALHLAAEADNSGLRGQIAFLVEHLGKEEAGRRLDDLISSLAPMSGPESSGCPRAPSP